MECLIDAYPASLLAKKLQKTENYKKELHKIIHQKRFTKDQKSDFTIRKEIIWESEASSIEELNRIEVMFIEKFQSNDPDIGYNRRLKFKK